MAKQKVIGLLIIATSHALYARQSVGANPTALQLEPACVDFKTVSAGELPIRHVSVKNTEQVPIRLSGVRSSCSCTSATMEATTLQPGDEASITIALDLQDYPADKVSSTVYVSVEGYELTFPVIAIVRREYAVYPESVEFGSVKRVSKSRHKFYVYQVGAEELLLKEVKTPANVTATILEFGQATADLPPEIRGAKKVYEVKIEFLAPNDRDLYKGDITVVTSAKRLPEWTLPVRAELKGIDFAFEPSVVIFEQALPGATVGDAVLTVGEASILQATSSDKYIAASFTEVERNRKYSLHLISTQDAEPGSHSGKIQVRLQQGDLTQDVELLFYGTIK